jgi:glycosyltransferase involved in cell wall biosynthesis
MTQTRSRTTAASHDVNVVHARIPQAQPLRAWAEHFPLIVHCHLRWDFVWQRPQQILSRLASSHRIAFIEEPILDAEVARLDISEPHPNLIRIVPRLPAGFVDTDAQCAQVVPLLQAAMDAHPSLSGRFDDAVQWFQSPMTAPVFLGRFGARGIVYDCMDELANFRFAPPDIKAREAYLIEHADVVFTGGYQLFSSKSRMHDNVHFYGCGVDVAHFGKARDAATVVPRSVAALPGPVFGYFGVIDERIDYPLLEALADRFPDASIAMVGPLAKVQRDELPQRPNLHWLGQADYADLPALVKGFDVCLMPFALNEATQYINPTKTLEYMAAGKPIVSTAIADVVRNFTPVVAVADTHAAFCDRVEQAWRSPDAASIAEGIARAEGATWDATVASMEQDLRNAIAPKRLRAQASA